MGNKWSFSALREVMTNHGISYDLIQNRIDDLIVKTIISVENILFTAFESQVPFRNNCFELFGFDILIDS